MINISKEIERLLQFALKNNIIEKLDIVPLRNELLELFKVEEPYLSYIEEEDLQSPFEILKNMLDYAYEIGLLKENTTVYRDLLDAKIMGILMPRQSEIANKFYTIYKDYGAKHSTDYFYHISKASNYIRMDRIKKNLYWNTNTEYGDLEITINLSKPEKDPKDIEALKNAPQKSYPKCFLCLENVGYSGRINHPARQNHRVIPVKITGENWFLQYSPYVYYNEHCILFYEKHVPMKISDKTFLRLLDFVEKFPHYFIGSNADLPIVGGSILSHEHFQGGRHVFPMEKAPILIPFQSEKYKNVKAGIVKWPMSVIRISSNNKEELARVSSDILILWRNYNDEGLDIICKSYNGQKKTLHNTVTPIARINSNGEYEMDLVLRNNRRSSTYPEGIFHPHRQFHHIKKENIGLIEVMGLAVLPGRLNKELKEIESILMGDRDILVEAKNNEKHALYKHIAWIEELISKYKENYTLRETKNIIKEEVGKTFLNILKDAGVFKVDEKGLNGFIKFMEKAGFKKT